MHRNDHNPVVYMRGILLVNFLPALNVVANITMAIIHVQDALKQHVLHQVKQRDAHLVVRRFVSNLARHLAQQHVPVVDILKDVSAPLGHALAVNKCDCHNYIVPVQLFKSILMND